ncbi:phage/plasmid primase, P4 family [Paracoccus sp. P2]|uniref:DNA primase family protein n=1 Tax=Paracoccus sp. P2 TaxID=3248840 RepID=UPI00391F70C8
MSLLGSYPEKKLLFFVGGGDNGKSVIEKVVRAVMGTYAGRVAAEALMQKNMDSGHTDAIARIAGRRFVASSEIKIGKTFDDALLKSITGDGVMEVSRKGEKGFEMRSQAKLVLQGNSLPHMKDLSKGMASRFRVVRFHNSMPEEQQDKYLAERLASTEGAGIMQWLLDGLRDYWAVGGLKEPKSVLEDSAEYMGSQDLIANFLLDEAAVIDPNECHPRSDVWSRYLIWTRASNIQHSWTKPTFYEALRERGYTHPLKRNGIDHVRGFRLHLTPQNHPHKY